MGTYREETKQYYIKKLRAMLENLPDYCRYYFNAKAHTFEVRTEVAYAIDLRIFFEYLKQTKSELKALPIKDIPLDVLENLSSHDIDGYLTFLELYSMDGRERENKDNGKSRKFASLKSFYKYLMRENMIHINPTELVDPPKLHNIDIITLTKEEKEKLLHVIDTSDGMTKRQRKYHRYCQFRDKALLMLLLGTGLRVSELVGLNLSDIDLDKNMARVIRKGGSKDHVYFSNQIKKALNEYLSPSHATGTRNSFEVDENEQALFISMKKGRLTVRAVQKLIQTYSKIAFGDKNELKISPHKMRKTYGTELYQKTNDIKLVADTLGHSNVTTTSNHYIATREEHKKNAAIDVID